MPILESKGLVKSYGRRRVVDGVSFHVEQGEIVGLLGPNGAGKTTSFRMTCGLLEADKGQVLLNGLDVTGWPMYRRAREGGMGYLAQEQSVFRKLTVEQNLLAVMELIGMDRRARKKRCAELLEQFDIVTIRNSLAMSCSGGEKRRIEIARCLVSNPQIILLDEPFTGIDPVTINSIQAIIRRLRDEGISILITDHRERETLAVTDRNYVIRAGQVLCAGTAEEVLGNADARKYYFGDDPGMHRPKPNPQAAAIDHSSDDAGIASEVIHPGHSAVRPQHEKIMRDKSLADTLPFRPKSTTQHERE